MFALGDTMAWSISECLSTRAPIRKPQRPLRPTVVAPLVLQVAAIDVDLLQYVVLVAYCHVVEAVIRILEAGYEFCRHEEEALHGVRPLCAGGNDDVRRAAVGVGVNVGAVVALALGVHHGREDRQLVGAVAHP